MPDPDQELNLLHISDTHLHATRESRMRGVNTHDTLTAVLNHVRVEAQWPPRLVLATGDLVQDESRQGYEQFRDMLAPLDVAVACIPGNHDDPELMEAVLNRPPFQVGGVIEMGNWGIVMLNTFIFGDDGGRLGAAQLADLATQLERLGDRHALIAMHHQPIPMGSAWLDGVGLKDAEPFLGLIDGFPNVAGVIWGHVHQASDRQRGKIRMLSTPSTCSQFRPDSDHFALDDRPPGYRWIRLRPNGEIDTELVWVR